jgi:hypothetical protein
MQTHHKRFFDSLDFENHVRDANGVDLEDKDLGEALGVLDSITEDRLEEYENSQEYTPPSRERREARQRAEYRLQQIEDAPPVSGTH